MAVKRFREEEQAEELLRDGAVETANCLMLLSKVGEATAVGGSERVFECKSCKKKFHSFQALGGHRASHRKLRLMAADLLHQALPAKPKTHACSICGLEFPMGQALGGHMRRHRAAIEGEKSVVPAVHNKSDAKRVPVLMRSNSSKRVFGFQGLDLNLTPDENDLKRRKIFPLLDFFHSIA